MFIHGGGYIVGGSGWFNPGSFVTNHDVVVVTVNYRLGIFGFLSTGDKSAPGNFGLWDMTLALQWIKSNIAPFGGDPLDVTISGESAGGSAVGYLSISPHTKKLFTKAYPQSGTATSSFGKATTALKATLELAKSVNCFDGDASESIGSEVTRQVIECLRQKPISDFTSFASFTLDDPRFVPTVDKDFIPRSPQELILDDAYLEEVGFFDRSYLVGIVNNEACVYKTHVDLTLDGMRQMEGVSDEEKEAMVKEFVESAYSFCANSRMNEPVADTVVDKVVDWYKRRYNGNDILSEMIGDLSFIIPTYDFIDAASRGANTKVWLFHFNHYPRYMTGKSKGIVHGLDLAYWFDISVKNISQVLMVEMDFELGMGEDDLKLKQKMSDMIATFTQTG